MADPTGDYSEEAGQDGMCALCRKMGPLRESHIVPKFAVTWLKKTSVTGRFRRSDRPNARSQDHVRVRLLCEKCEVLFSKWEGEFARRIFHPRLDKGATNCRYEEWLRKFAVSLAWRTGVVTKDLVRGLAEDLTFRLNRALEDWRRYLLGLDRTSGRYSHHMMYLRPVTYFPNHIPVPRHFHWYLMRTIDTDLVHTPTSVYVFTKLPGFVFWSSIHPPEADGWFYTRILKKGECGSPLQRCDDRQFGYFLLNRAAHAWHALDSISFRQKELIRSDYMRIAEERGVDPRVFMFLSADQALKRQRGR